ncbi:MAG: hypothetical protein AB7P50_10295, partial [Alphaproteobacteria bacterium]
KISAIACLEILALYAPLRHDGTPNSKSTEDNSIRDKLNNSTIAGPPKVVDLARWQAFACTAAESNNAIQINAFFESRSSSRS